MALNVYLTYTGETQGSFEREHQTKEEESFVFKTGSNTAADDQHEDEIDILLLDWGPIQAAADGTTEHFFTVEISEGRIHDTGTTFDGDFIV